MAQLLVRNLDESVVRRLKKRAAERGISAEEHHRQILREALMQQEVKKPSLIEYLMTTEVCPDVELDISRSREIEERDIGF